MQFKSFEKDVQVNGQTVFSVIDGLGTFKSLAKKYLLNVGIGKSIDNNYDLDLQGWYSQDAWLRAFENIAKEVGSQILLKIGLSIPNNAKFPPWVNDIHTAIKSIDIAYHMNHRKDGNVLFDMKANKMSEGIGHYGYEKVDGKNMIISECVNPYPCVFDKGIITAMAQKFELKATVIHDDSKPCRTNGAESCTYIITW